MKAAEVTIFPGPEDRLPAMLIYHRCCITYVFTGFLFNSHETTVMRSVSRIERIAVKVIHIEKNRQLSREEVEYLITDVTEQPVRRPERKQKKYYSGKKKRHKYQDKNILTFNCISNNYIIQKKK